MLNRIKTWFSRGYSAEDGANAEADGLSAYRMAAVALMVEAARMDDAYGEAERETIRRVLTERFELAPEEVETMLEAGEARQDQAVELYGFTRAIKEGLAAEERVTVIEMLWEVVYADGVVHDYEAHLLRRVAGLIYVSDRERAEARQRVLARLEIEG